MAENRVIIEGMVPPGAALPVAQAAPAKSSAPITTNVLAASADGDQTLFSMSAGDIWYGFFTLSGTLVGTSKTAKVTISNLGASCTPAAGTELVALNLATGTSGDSIALSSRTPYLYIYAGNGDNDVHADVTGDPATLSATAYGYLLS